jgi:hypothetical protein
MRIEGTLNLFVSLFKILFVIMNYKIPDRKPSGISSVFGGRSLTISLLKSRGEINTSE